MSSARTDTDSVVRDVVARYAILRSPVEDLGDGDDLYAAGLTSHASVSVMLAVEDAFDLEFPDDLLTKQTFASISSIAAAVDQLLGGS